MTGHVKQTVKICALPRHYFYFRRSLTWNGTENLQSSTQVHQKERKFNFDLFTSTVFSNELEKNLVRPTSTILPPTNRDVLTVAHVVARFASAAIFLLFFLSQNYRFVQFCAVAVAITMTQGTNINGGGLVQMRGVLVSKPLASRVVHQSWLVAPPSRTEFELKSARHLSIAGHTNPVQELFRGGILFCVLSLIEISARVGFFFVFSSKPHIGYCIKQYNFSAKIIVDKRGPAGGRASGIKIRSRVICRTNTYYV